MQCQNVLLFPGPQQVSCLWERFVAWTSWNNSAVRMKRGGTLIVLRKPHTSRDDRQRTAGKGTISN